MPISPPSFWRSPRLKPVLPQAVVEIPAPPAAPSPPGSLLPVLLPVGLMVVVMILVAAFQPGTASMLILTVPMMLVGGVASFVTFRRQKQEYEAKTATRHQKYMALLDRYGNTLKDYLTQQQEALQRKDPDPENCFAWIEKLDRHLWARQPEDEDFLEVRIGLGDQPSSVQIKVPPLDNLLDPDPLIEAAHKLAREYSVVHDVPVCLKLRQPGGTGIAGPRQRALAATRAALLQLAAHHSPDDVKIVAIFAEAETAEWAWLRWLPHVWSEDRSRRFLANNPEGVRNLCAMMSNLFNSRKRYLQEHRSSEPPAWPYHLVFVLADETLIENEPFIQRLQAEGTDLGAHVIFLGESVRALPKECVVAARLSDDAAHVMLLDQKIRLPYDADVVSRELAEQFALAMAPIQLRRPASVADIPTSLSFLELFGAQDVKDLDVLSRWRRSAQAGRSLATPIGMRGGGEPLIIDLHERAHGPNGLVAGMVGAGKSELLQTLVASLAINYHPHRVAFVLVDYKGGGMADPFVALPHTLGVITNLQQGNLAVRALTSFQVEAERRQLLFREAGVNHIDDYQRLYYRGQVKEPLPYLVIIVDEFAEMKTEQPDVAREFVRIARIGRALGFRLILAMQKPEGIVDGQIEANTRFRLCLRVAQTADSQAMLKRPDAAYLSGVGRAYFQVGADEIYDLFQVAWSGAPYDPENLSGENPLEITEIALDGSRTALYQPPRMGLSAEVTQLKAIVEHLHQLAESQAVSRLPGPWLPPLPEVFPLEAVPRIMSGGQENGADRCFGWDGHGWQPVPRRLAPVVGVIDDPRHRAQPPLQIDLSRESHLVVYGAPGYGTTTFLQTFVTSLALTYTPADVNLYILDFGGHALRVFERLPHVGAVITADETERVERLLRFLLRELERRKELGAARGAAGSSLPAIVVVLDSYASFIEANDEAGQAEEREAALVQLAREGGSVDMHLVVTATSPASIRYRVSSNITGVVALRLAEASEYSAIVGRVESLPPTLPGRGLVKGNPPLEFQTALPIAGATDAERNAGLVALAHQMAAAWVGSRPKPIQTLPRVVPLSDLVRPTDGWIGEIEEGNDGLSVPLGLTTADLLPLMVDLRAGPHFVIAGPVQSGKTSLLQTWLLALATRCPPAQLHFYLVDSRRLGLAPLADLPHVRAYADTAERADAVIAEVERLVAERQALYDAVRRKIDAAAGDVSTPAILLALDDLLDEYDDNAKNCQSQLVTIARQGRRLGIYLLITCAVNQLNRYAYNELITTLRETPVGFRLDASSDDSFFSLRLPYGERDKILPLGQGYWVRRGQAVKVQLATAHVGTPALSAWVKQLAEAHQ